MKHADKMILERLGSRLRQQDWIAVAIELAIVILGVFIAMQVSNWNENRIARAGTRQLLEQLKPELAAIAEFGDNARDYYAVTHANAQTAFKGWAGDPAISDDQFIVAAYQASQVRGFGTNGENWALIFGADQIRNIEDPAIRQKLIELMVFNYDNLELAGLATRYREQVRRVIPDGFQARIRSKCGDRRPPGRTQLNILPVRCELDFPDSAAARTASALRSRTDLPEDLRWHESVVATFLFNARTLELHAAELEQLIDRQKN